MTISRETAVEQAITSNLEFLLLDRINKMAGAIVKYVEGQNADVDIEQLPEELKTLLGLISKACVESKGLISAVLEHHSDQLGEFSDANPGEADMIRIELEGNPTILEMRRTLEMTPQERIIEILTKAGKLNGHND